ncbi:MAG: DUF4352 domain-containing protein [Ardenticatenaceae bacterium]|nr:DUF4352 domain-containing protein [Ardenticatenaceae bacterium]MCB9443581.1 DUF4352 domain-containing protein [Ardenticatenaceae bacterium]
MSSEQPEQSNNSLKDIFVNNRGLAIVVGLLVVGFVAMFVMVLVLLLRDSGTADVTPTPFADSAESAAVDEPLVVGVSDTDRISVTLDVPVSLGVKGNTFLVQSQTVADDRIWSPTFENTETAVWVYGTIINYVIGVPESDSNRAALEQLAPGDLMQLTTKSGIVHTFTFSSREQILVGNPDVYAQHAPGLTLILVGTGGEERLVVNGRYLVDEAGSSGSAGGSAVELGETAQLDDVQIVVNSAAYVLDRPEAQPGFAFYLIDYQIQNISLTALDTSRLQFSLLDELGNQYAVNPVAAQLGNHPALGGFLNASQTVLATAGYQIPLGLNSSNVHWLATNLNTGAQLQVTIPFSGGAQAAGNAQVTLSQVSVSNDLTNLVLTGQVTNLGSQPLSVAETAVSLRTDDGSVYLLLSTNPAFPWTVGPGQSTPFVLTFQRPMGVDTAVFTVLNQPFQLTNLR